MQGNGVGTISTLLSNEGMSLPQYVQLCIHNSHQVQVNRCLELYRDFIRKVLATYAAEGLTQRFPGAHRIPRSALVAIGLNHQHHADGHDKLNAQVLNMGGVGLGIYGIKDQWLSFILHLVTVPNNRLVTTVGHVHLDCIEQHKRMWLNVAFVRN